VKDEDPGSRLLLPPTSSTSRLPHHSSLSLTPSSSSSSTSAYSTHFPVPPPLIPYPKSPFLPPTHAGGGGFPTPPTDPLHSPGCFPWASPTLTALGMLPAFSPLPGTAFPTSPFTSSSLLTPSPSYHSSAGSSREELQHSHHQQLFLHHAAAAAAAAAMDKKPLLTAPTPRYGPIPSLQQAAGRVLPDSSSPAPTPSSPMLSPRTWSHSWPTPVWQCFVAGKKRGLRSDQRSGMFIPDPNFFHPGSASKT
jgi:hypothetical protein